MHGKKCATLTGSLPTRTRKPAVSSDNTPPRSWLATSQRANEKRHRAALAHSFPL